MVSDADPLPVYLVHWDAPEWCRSAAMSVLSSTGVRVELTIVDNGQRGGRPLGELLPGGVRVITMPGNTGFSGGANAALSDWRSRHPEGELCVVGSHDLHVEPGTFSTLVAAAAARPDCGVLGPGFRLTEGDTAIYGSAAGGPASQEAVVERRWVIGACLMLRRGCVDDVGAFDERFGSYGEDVDFGLRANEHGWRVGMVTTAAAWGLGSASPRSVRLKAANGVLLAAKRGGLRAAVARVGHLIVLIARGAAAGVAPWRTPGERAVSCAWARQRAAALLDLATTRRLLDVLRRPGDAVPVGDAEHG